MRALACTLLLLALTAIGSPALAGEKFITIGTAGEMGVYYPAGGAICRLLKLGIKEHGIRCFVERTSGSVYNLEALRSGELDVALAQADWIYHAYKGTGEFAKDGPDTSLRSIFSLHTEVFTVLARTDSGIASIHDLLGKRIGIAVAGSGMRATAEEFMRAEGWNKENFAELVELKSVEDGKALCAGQVDAIFFTTGHPNGGTEEITHRCATHIIPVVGAPIAKMIHDNPYYLHVTLPGGMYPGSPKPVATFGMKAVLVTSSKVDENTIYHVVKAVFDNLDNFKTLHPVFSSLDKHAMMSEGLIVPLHPGALKYYREVGLIK